MRPMLVATIALVVSSPLCAQTSAPAVPSAARQIAAAVLPLPLEMRAGARVWGYAPDGRFVELRPGTGGMTCIADDPKEPHFHVACYANSMEPFMARGRELRAQNVEQNALDSIRTADVRAGRIRMPPVASLYSLTGPAGSWDSVANTTHGANPLYVLYLPFATEAETGIPATPRPGQPWLMHPGAPNAHLMIVGSMQ